MVGSCRLPDGFKSVNVRRRGKGLRILFTRKGHRNPVRVEVFQTSKGRTDLQQHQAGAGTSRAANAPSPGAGAGARASALSNGVYFVRFRTLDANKRLDSRRVVVERKKGRFAKKPGFS